MENSMLENYIPLAHLPTPIEYMPRLSKLLGVSLYIKRDDLTETVASGNKLRKLEYFLYDAQEKNATTLITCGGIQSNHCRATAWVAAKMGLKSLLLLRGKEKSFLQGNLLLNKVMGGETRFFDFHEFRNISRIIEEVKVELEKSGEVPYVIPLGGSNALGSIGYIRAMKEVADENLHFDHTYVTLGSGGTLAGIVAGCDLYNVNTQVHGIAVSDSTPYFYGQMERLQREFKEQFSIDMIIPTHDSFIDDNYVGIGYAKNREEELKDLLTIAHTEGVILDPVYTLKCFRGLMGHIEKGIIRTGSSVLFVHTGGLYGLFPKHHELESIFDEQ